MEALLLLVLLLFGLWALVCVGGMAMCFLPFALLYVALGVGMAGKWLACSAVELWTQAIARYQRRRQIKRLYRWAEKRQAKAWRATDHVFEQATKAMERVSVR